MRMPWLCQLSMLLFLAAGSLVSLAHGEDVVPRRQAHAHNDYLHPRPLLDALDQGFCSVEADIFLVDGKLLVAHAFSELRPERSLQSLYLDPLRKRIQENGGSVFGDGKPVTLLIDLKTDGETTFQALNQLLGEYRDVFRWTENGESHPGAVTAIVSGNRPIATIAAASPRFVGIDGRLSDRESDASVDLMPLVSDNWTQHFKWRGKGELPPEEQRKLNRTVEQLHSQGRLVRFWATPDSPAVWKVLKDAGVDLINTDDLEGLSRFLRTP